MLTKVQAKARRSATQPRSLVILGATGSIGCSAADVLDAAPGAFHVEAVAACRDVKGLAAVARRLSARFAAVYEPGMYAELKAELSGSGIEIAAGTEAVIEAAQRPADLVLGAIAGAAGVEPTHAALSAGRTIALANKECLVCAGAPFMRTAAQVGAKLLPVDSEHNAIFQALGGEPIDRVERMTLTASGGPFRTWTANAIGAATPEQALAHPNWTMGRKVTIDSATLMNKGLELIEAHYIFGIAADRLDVLVHPQSIVHGLVSFADGSVTAGLAVPDMKVPIAHCLGFPVRLSTPTRRLDLAMIGTLTFERPDFERFPALKVAMDALKNGGGLPTVLNAANEIAVEAFLDRRMGFGDIARFVSAACEAALADGTAQEPRTVGEALAVDHIVRERSRSLLARTTRSGMVTLQ
jgi:1-deoxy-D-xylulose-5-phosphate reductoisomerase